MNLTEAFIVKLFEPFMGRMVRIRTIEKHDSDDRDWKRGRIEEIHGTQGLRVRTDSMTQITIPFHRIRLVIDTEGKRSLDVPDWVRRKKPNTL